MFFLKNFGSTLVEAITIPLLFTLSSAILLITFSHPANNLILVSSAFWALIILLILIFGEFSTAWVPTACRASFYKYKLFLLIWSTNLSISVVFGRCLTFMCNISITGIMFETHLPTHLPSHLCLTVSLPPNCLWKFLYASLQYASQIPQR